MTVKFWSRFQVDTPMWVVAFAINAFSTSRGENPKQRKLNKGNACEVEIKLEDSVLQTLYGSKKETMAFLEAPYYCEFDKPVRIAPNTLYIASVFVQVIWVNLMKKIIFPKGPLVTKIFLC